MKTIVVIVRVVLGLIFTAFSLAFFFKLMPPQEMDERTQTVMAGIFASGYIMPVVKFLELICGIAFLTGRFVPLALVMIFPIVLNIFLFHAFLEPGGMIVPIILLGSNLFLAFFYRERYQNVLTWK